MSTQDTTLPPPCGWPTMLELFIDASATLIRQAQAAECNEHNYEQLLSAVQRVTDYGQQGLSALTKQARAAIAAQAQQPSYGSISDRAERGLDAGLWKAQQAQGVPDVSQVMALADEYAGAAACAEFATSKKDEDTSEERAALESAIRALLAAAPQAEPVQSNSSVEVNFPEPIAEIGPDYSLRFVGAEPIATLLARHPGVRVGSLMVSVSEAQAYAQGQFHAGWRIAEAKTPSGQAEPQPVHRRHTDAEALSCADRLNRSFPPSSLKDEAADHIRELVAASAEPQPEREPIPRVLFDGFSVLQALDPKAKARTSSENVSDVLDAVVKIMRAGIGTKGGDK